MDGGHKKTEWDSAGLHEACLGPLNSVHSTSGGDHELYNFYMHLKSPTLLE